MKRTDIALLRLKSQQLSVSEHTTAKSLVSWMGAIQAQDYAMSKWAVGARIPGSTDAAIEQAINDGTILRTHVLRPTWHIVSAADIHWMIELTAPKIRSSMQARHRELEITPDLIAKTLKQIERLLENANHLTREELVSALKDHKISLTGEQATHIMGCAELEMLICSGIVKGNKQTYALLSERSPKKKQLIRDEALEKLARTYFTSHGPATLADFTWWSGLPAPAARESLELIKDRFVSFVSEEQEYWLTSELAGYDPKKQSTTQLLPAFDEFLISYKDRTATIRTEYQPKAFSNNGIFRPTIVINGQTTGIWKRTAKKDSVLLETNVFFEHVPEFKQALEKAAEKYAAFLGKKLVLADYM